MAISTFGVTHDSVRAHHFPQYPSAFSGASNPTASTVTEKVKDGAAELAGKLAREGLSAATLNGDPVTYAAAYQWCSKYIRLYAAIGTLQAGATADPEVAKAWRSELKDMREDLEKYGHLALGDDAPAPAQNANGPITHISANSLETTSSEDMPDVLPTFSRSDML